MTQRLDWQAWHSEYDSDTPLRRRLEIVQRRIGEVLDTFEGSPLRVVSMCAGEGRDLLGALDRHARRDISGRLVELDPELADRARAHATALGLDGPGSRDRRRGRHEAVRGRRTCRPRPRVRRLRQYQRRGHREDTARSAHVHGTRGHGHCGRAIGASRT